MLAELKLGGMISGPPGPAADAEGTGEGAGGGGGAGATEGDTSGPSARAKAAAGVSELGGWKSELLTADHGQDGEECLHSGCLELRNVLYVWVRSTRLSDAV